MQRTSRDHSARACPYSSRLNCPPSGSRWQPVADGEQPRLKPAPRATAAPARLTSVPDTAARRCRFMTYNCGPVVCHHHRIAASVAGASWAVRLSPDTASVRWLILLELACKRTKENPRIGGLKHQRLIKGHAAGNMREITQLCCHSSPPLLIVAARIKCGSGPGGRFKTSRRGAPSFHGPAGKNFLIVVTAFRAASGRCSVRLLSASPLPELLQTIDGHTTGAYPVAVPRAPRLSKLKRAFEGNVTTRRTMASSSQHRNIWLA